MSQDNFRRESRTQTILSGERDLSTLVGQRMAIRLMRLDGDDSRGQYIEVYLSVYIRNKKKKVHNLKMKESEDD